MSIDVTNDMDIFDYLQDGVFYSRNFDDTFTPHPDIECLRRVINKHPTSAGVGVVQQDSTIWHIKKSDMDTAVLVPRFQDRILDTSGDYWWIEKYTLETLGSRYRCETTRVKNL